MIRWLRRLFRRDVPTDETIAVLALGAQDKEFLDAVEAGRREEETLTATVKMTLTATVKIPKAALEGVDRTTLEETIRRDFTTEFDRRVARAFASEILHGDPRGEPRGIMSSDEDDEGSFAGPTSPEADAAGGYLVPAEVSRDLIAGIRDDEIAQRRSNGGWLHRIRHAFRPRSVAASLWIHRTRIGREPALVSGLRCHECGRVDRVGVGFPRTSPLVMVTPGELDALDLEALREEWRDAYALTPAWSERDEQEWGAPDVEPAVEGAWNAREV